MILLEFVFTVLCVLGLFSATTGWDATTGLGTPNFEEMIKAMAAMDSLNAPSASLLAQAKSLRGSF